MALQTWPAELPQQFLVESYQRTSPENRHRSSVDGAVKKQRRKYTNVAQPFSGEMIMTADQRDSFWTFFRDNLKWGVLAFNFPTPAKFDGSFITCQFGDELPSENAVSHTHWRISISLEQIR